MSLINEMLQDIEARGGGNVNDDVRVPAREHKTSPHRGLLMLLALLVVILGGTIAYLVMLERSVAGQGMAVTVPAQTVVSEPVGTPVAIPVAIVEPATEIEPPAPAQEVAVVEERVAVLPEEIPDAQPLATDTVAPAEPVTGTPAIEANDPAETVIVRRHEPTDAEKTRRARLEGFAALHRSDWLMAARMLGELIKLEPANDDAREGLVVALAQQGRMSEADGVLLDGLAVGVQPARFAKLRARLQASQGDIAAALQSLSVAVPPVEADSEFHAMKGALAQQAGEYALALQTYRALVAFAPGNGTWQAGLAMALDQAGEPAQALEAYRRAFAAGDLEPALLAHVRQRLDALSNE